MFNSRHIYQEATASRALRVSKGLFVLRYISSKADSDAPSVAVTAKPGSGVDVITPEGSVTGFLGSPGEAVVVRVSRDSFLSVNILPLRSGGSQDAHLQFERISSSPTPDFCENVAQHAFADKSPLPTISPNLEIVAHVAMRGDMVVPAGEWICGPQLPMAIEGIKLNWYNKPSGVDIITSGAIMSRGRVVLTPAGTGVFVGTRGKSAPLVGLGLALTGPLAEAYTLICEAFFLGASLCSRQGISVDLSGPTGLEPLVGLRLSLKISVEAVTSQTYQGVPPETSLSPDLTSGSLEIPTSVQNGRVRVFRTSRSRSSSLQR